jgi:hypothetical protein
LKNLSLFPVLLGPMMLLASTGPAYAYLDPGTGSILLQMLLGGVAGGLVVIRLYWARIKSWFSPKPASTDDGEGPDRA